MNWNHNDEGYYNYNTRGNRPSRLKNLVKNVLLVIVSAFMGGVLALGLYSAGNGNIPSPSNNSPETFQNPSGSNQNQPAYNISTENVLSDWPVTSIAEIVGPSVVGISNISEIRYLFGGRQEVEQGSGSGVIITDGGYIVTNQHVIADAQRVLVSFADGRQLEAVIRGQDADSDLAILKVEGDHYPAVILGDSNQVRVGELVVAIGNPLGNEFARSVTMGVISAKDRQVSIDEKKMTLLQTDAAINPGNSGGALVNASGQLIGINSAKLTGNVEGMGFAIPINDAKPIMDELIEKGYVSKPSMGIVGYAIDARLSARTGLPQGIFVQEVTSNEARAAGLRADDIIISIDGQIIDNSTDLKDFLNTRKVGDAIQLKVNRNNREMDMILSLIERRG
jgi:serine protease Do